MKIIENIEKLSNLHGVSGHEHNVAKCVKDIFAPFCDECTMDAMGNEVSSDLLSDRIPMTQISTVLFSPHVHCQFQRGLKPRCLIVSSSVES